MSYPSCYPPNKNLNPIQPTEPKNAFLIMRANGWSLRSISKELGVPKSTLFNWESDPALSRAISVFKSLQLEKLQEQYIPSFEEELQKLSTCLSRIETALEKHDFDAMRPEFLLRTSLQLRSRLNSLRSDVQPIRTLDGELPPIPLLACISRSKRVHDFDDSSPSEDRDNVPQADLATAKETEWDKTEIFQETQPSAPATSAGENGTLVHFPNRSPRPAASEPDREHFRPVLAGPYRGGDLATPLANIPADVSADQIALTAGFAPRRSQLAPVSRTT